MPITPDPRSDILIIEQAADRLIARTKIPSWWMGGAALLAIAGVAAYLLGQSWDLALKGDFGALAKEWAGCLVMMAFLSLFLFGLTHDRLEVANGTLTYEWRLGPFKLKHKSAPLAEITELASDSSTDSDGGGSFYLLIKSAGWEARFASDSTHKTVDEIQKAVVRIKKN